jgi:hypothetical protein
MEMDGNGMSQGTSNEFNNWIESIFSYLEDEYSNCGLHGLHLDAGELNETHWNQLRMIFENQVERIDGGNKDSIEVLDTISYEAGGIVLDAHGKNYDDLNSQQQMDHYLNSGSYD